MSSLSFFSETLSGSGKGTSPVVRERVMDVLAAAAYASGTRESSLFPFYSIISRDSKSFSLRFYSLMRCT